MLAVENNLEKAKNLVKETKLEHIAIIMDGNGRWAKERSMDRSAGHVEGVNTVRRITEAASEAGVRYLTLYAFSTENWNRPKDEVKYLMYTPIRYYKKYKNKIWNSSYQIRFIGKRDRIPAELLQIIQEIENKTKDHTGLTLTLCVDYGAYDELTTAVKEIASLVSEKKLSIDQITKECIEQHLFTKDYPNLDLLIRTSGEVRISNFLLWQLGYAELYFTDVLWPDFNRKELEKAILSYQSRDRRFGGLNENK